MGRTPCQPGTPVGMRWCAAWKVTLSGSVDFEFVIVAEDQRSVIEGNRPATRKSPVTPERTGAGNDVVVIFMTPDARSPGSLTSLEPHVRRVLTRTSTATRRPCSPIASSGSVASLTEHILLATPDDRSPYRARRARGIPAFLLCLHRYR